MSDHKYSIPDDHEWADEKEPASDDAGPVIDVGRHSIQINDYRDEHGYEYGLEWLFGFEDGVLSGYYVGHWLEGRTQSDPMDAPAWKDVPEVVKAALRIELGLEVGEKIPTDLPDFYGGDGDE